MMTYLISCQKVISNSCPDLVHYTIEEQRELEKTLKEVEGSENIKTLSGFEHGRSTNLEHLIKYVKQIESKDQKQKFLQGLITVIEGDSDEQ